MKIFLIRTIKVLLATLSVFVAGVTILFFVVSAPPETSSSEQTVNDVTQLNPIQVDAVHRPEHVADIISLIKNHDGPISIGGARHSMGGQIGSEHTLHLDMRDFDEVIAFDKMKKEITVEPGITWRKIQEYIDVHNLSVSIMQTYANFTVGGSLSVNVHGRYIGQGSIIHSVKSLKIVLANGDLVHCSPEENADLFYGSIGGYGGLGVIVGATLQLTDNGKVARQSETMPVYDYKNFFMQHVRNDSTIVFHNTDIYPDDYQQVRAVSYLKTDEPVSIEDRLKPVDKDYRVERFAMWIVSELPAGKWIRQKVVDPAFYKGKKVVWRNYEASYDALELEPTSRKNYTYVLQEYFVPIDRFDAFVPLMAGIFQRHHVNVINISIRHARADKGSLLTWAPKEVFCFVVYYKQGTTEADRQNVGVWTRELIDAALAQQGSYYLPYQLHATTEQFGKAYKNSAQFFALKTKVDPTNKFRNKLWDKYYQPETDGHVETLVAP